MAWSFALPETGTAKARSEWNEHGWANASLGGLLFNIDVERTDLLTLDGQEFHKHLRQFYMAHTALPPGDSAFDRVICSLSAGFSVKSWIWCGFVMFFLSIHTGHTGLGFHGTKRSISATQTLAEATRELNLDVKLKNAELRTKGLWDGYIALSWDAEMLARVRADGRRSSRSSWDPQGFGHRKLSLPRRRAWCYLLHPWVFISTTMNQPHVHIGLVHDASMLWFGSVIDAGAVFSSVFW